MSSTLSLRSRILLCALATYLPTYLDGSEHKPAPRRSERASRFFRAAVKALVARCFDIKEAIVEAPKELEECKQVILAVHPHGVLSLDHLLTVISYDDTLEKALPQSRRSALSAGVLFKIPVIREVLLWTGCVDAGGKTVDACLKAGLSLSVVPGGEREQLLAQRGSTECLVLRNRRGFIKYALKHGTPVVPVYCFGENQLYHQSSMLAGVRSWIQRKFGIALVAPFGRLGVPGLFPYSESIRMVIGAPVKLPYTPEPDLDDVLEHHQRYMNAVQALFKRHQDAAGYPNSVIEFV